MCDATQTECICYNMRSFGTFNLISGSMHSLGLQHFEDPNTDGILNALTAQKISVDFIITCGKDLKILESGLYAIVALSHKSE